MLKRILSLTLLIGGLATLSSALSDERWMIGFAQDTLGNDWRVAQVRDVQRVLEQHPQVDFFYTDAQGEAAIQAQHIEDMTARGVDLIITSPLDQDLLVPAIEQAYQQGIPVVLLTRRIRSDAYTSYVTLDNQAIAEAAAHYLVEHLQGEGHILMLKGVQGASTTEDRKRGFMQVIEEHPQIQVTATRANFLRADAILAVAQLLAEGQQFDAIYAQSDSMATGARMALEQAGIDPTSLPIAGIDFISEARDAIKAGQQSISFTFQTAGKEGALLALQVLAGEEVPKRVELDSVAVTRDNVDQVEPIF